MKLQKAGRTKRQKSDNQRGATSSAAGRRVGPDPLPYISPGNRAPTRRDTIDAGRDKLGRHPFQKLAKSGNNGAKNKNSLKNFKK